MVFSIPLVTLDILLQNYSSIIRHATIQFQTVIVEIRKVFCFRKWPAKIISLPPVISQNTKQPNISTDDIL